MYQPDEVKPTAYAATGFPVNYNSGGAAYNSTTTTNTNTTAPHSTDSYQRPPPPRTLEDWSSGLCDCSFNVNNCCITCWCPCATFGQVAEIVDKGSTSCGASAALYTLCCLIGCRSLYSCCYRAKMRQQYSLRGNGCTDCLIHCCCEACALCQEYRELQNRGFNMATGWHGNVEQRSRGIAMTATAPPTAEHGMSR